MKHYVVFDAPVSKVDGLRATLLVDVYHCCVLLREQLNMEELNEQEKGLTG